MPPSHAGMEPSALPAFSPPSGVSSAPSFAASAADTAASALPASVRPATVPTRVAMTFFIMIVSSTGSERVLERGRDVVTVVDVVEPPGAAELGPRHFDRPGRAQVGFDAEREAIAPLDEVAARSRRRALHVMLPVEARQDVPGTDQARVFEPARNTISIGRGIGEPVLGFDEIQRETLRRRERRAV